MGMVKNALNEKFKKLLLIVIFALFFHGLWNEKSGKLRLHIKVLFAFFLVDAITRWWCELWRHEKVDFHLIHFWFSFHLCLLSLSCLIRTVNYRGFVHKQTREKVFWLKKERNDNGFWSWTIFFDFYGLSAIYIAALARHLSRERLGRCLRNMSLMNFHESLLKYFTKTMGKLESIVHS